MVKGAVDNTGAYNLVWSDEFNGHAVDTANCSFEIGAKGWGNHEQEYYQAVNATVANGKLVITGRNEDVKPGHDTSSGMITKGKRDFLYGKIEARIKMASGLLSGSWERILIR